MGVTEAWDSATADRTHGGFAGPWNGLANQTFTTLGYLTSPGRTSPSTFSSSHLYDFRSLQINVKIETTEIQRQAR
jgi:hypothetical protein